MPTTVVDSKQQSLTTANMKSWDYLFVPPIPAKSRGLFFEHSLERVVALKKLSPPSLRATPCIYSRLWCLRGLTTMKVSNAMAGDDGKKQKIAPFMLLAVESK